eukprot:PLAT14448.1.p2 GENE.PLAT14448.1~~PLAT14448.1.p2  ORF type:complete len:182 (-),score=69.17 PLAT14448.1:80-625(-)
MIKIFGVGRGRREEAAGDAKEPEKRQKPGEIRVLKDIAELDAGETAEVTFPDPDDLMNFNVLVKVDTGMWAGAEYLFTIHIPDMYPHEPPKVHCETKVYHPNIDLDGNVCLNILREDWKPVLSVNAVVYGLIYLFYEPNPDDPLNREAAEVFREDKEQFERNVRRSLRGGRMFGTEFPRLV